VAREDLIPPGPEVLPPFLPEGCPEDGLITFSSVPVSTNPHTLPHLRTPVHPLFPQTDLATLPHEMLDGRSAAAGGTSAPEGSTLAETIAPLANIATDMFPQPLKELQAAQSELLQYFQRCAATSASASTSRQSSFIQRPGQPLQPQPQARPTRTLCIEDVLLAIELAPHSIVEEGCLLPLFERCQGFLMRAEREAHAVAVAPAVQQLPVSFSSPSPQVHSPPP